MVEEIAFRIKILWRPCYTDPHRCQTKCQMGIGILRFSQGWNNSAWYGLCFHGNRTQTKSRLLRILVQALVLQSVIIQGVNLGVDSLPVPGSHFGLCKRLGVACGEQGALALLGWY